MATTDHTDDTILDEELDEHEFSLTNENEDNEDVLLAESEFDFVEKRTSPAESQSHPLPPQLEVETNMANEEESLEAEDVLDIGIADEDIETITFQDTPKATSDLVSEPYTKDTDSLEHQSIENDNNDRNSCSDVGENPPVEADQYDVEESISSPSAKASRDPPLNDDHSISDNHSSFNDDESDTRKDNGDAKATEDDKNVSSKQQRTISLKKSTSKTFDDLPDLSKVIEKVNSSASGRNRRKMEDMSSSGDRSRARYKRRNVYEEDRHRNDYRRLYTHRGDRYSDEDYDSDNRRSPRRTRSSPYFERDESSGDYDRFESQGEDRSCVLYGDHYYTPGEYANDYSSQQPLPPSNAIMDGSVVTSVQITQQTYRIGGDYPIQGSERVVVSGPPHNVMQPRPFAPRPLMQQPTLSPMMSVPRPQLRGQFHPRPPCPPSALMQQPPFARPPNPHYQPHRMPLRCQNQFPFMHPRPGAGPPPRGALPPPLRPQFGPPNGPPVDGVRQPLSSSGYPPGGGQQPPFPRPVIGPPPQMHSQQAPNVHRGPSPRPMCVPRPPPNNFAPSQSSPPVNNLYRLPPAPSHIRPPQPLSNNYRAPFANTQPNFSPSNNPPYPQNQTRMAPPPPPQNFRPNINPPPIMGQRPAWPQAPPQSSSFGAEPTQYKYSQPTPQGVERSHNDIVFDNRQVNYAGVGNDNEDRYFDNRDERRIQETDVRMPFSSAENSKRLNSSPIRGSPTKQSHYDYVTSNSLEVNKDEDEEMRLYQEKVEQQKKAREQYVRQKEEERLKSQMQNFIQNNIKGILEKREQLMRKQATSEPGSKSDRDRYESSRNKTFSRSDHDDYRSGRREERSVYDDTHSNRREERGDYEIIKRTVSNRDAEASRRDPPAKKEAPVVSTASGRSQYQHRLGNSSTERRAELAPSRKIAIRRSPSAERRPESASSKKIIVRRSPSAERRSEPVPSKKIVVRRSTTATQEPNVVAQRKTDEGDSSKKELHKLMKVRYKDGSVAYKSIPVRNSSGNMFTTAVDAPENTDRRKSDMSARLSVNVRKRVEQSDSNSRWRPLVRRAVVSSQMPTPNVTNEPTDEKTLIESIRKGIRQSSKTLAERFSNLKPSFVSDNDENESEGREMKKFRRVVPDVK